MTALVIDRATHPESVSSCFVARRIAVTQQQDGNVTLSPIIDPSDYDNDTDYLNAIPGMVESILEASHAPASERVPLEKLWDEGQLWRKILVK